MEIDAESVRRLREAFGSCDVKALAKYMTQLQFHQDAGAAPEDAKAAAKRLGWVHPDTGQLTELGWFAADSCREYVFWIERDRRLPFASDAPDLVRDLHETYDKDLLEIGSGAGVNLMALSGKVRSVTGVEPVASYRQLGALFAEAEGIDPPDVRPGAAEALPFPDGRFDIVLCVSAHQYFDIVPAIREIARVLRPGGEAIIIGGTLGSYTGGWLRQIAGGGRLEARSRLVCLANTLGYTALGYRPLTRRSRWSTAYPIYPPRRAMLRFLRDGGLEPSAPLFRIGPETCFRARKPA